MRFAGWQEARLGDVLQLKYGKPLEPARRTTGRYPVYGANGVKAWSDETCWNQPSIIVGRKGSAGEVTFAPDPFWALDVTYFVTFDSDHYELRFLYYLLKSLKLTRLANGVKPGLNRERVYRQRVVVPPRKEQARIAALLDNASEHLANAKASVSQNIDNARTLFASRLDAAYSRVAQAAPAVPLSDLAAAISDGDHQAPPKSPEGIPFITISNISKRSRTIDFTDCFRVPKQYFDALKSHRRPQKNDVLYTVTGSFGIPVVIRDNASFCFQRHIALIRPHDSVNSEWLAYVLMSRGLQQQAETAAKGAAQRTVSLTSLRNFKVPLVPRATQDAIVAELDATNEATQRLEAIYQRKLASLEALRASLLHHSLGGSF